MNQCKAVTVAGKSFSSSLSPNNGWQERQPLGLQQANREPSSRSWLSFRLLWRSKDIHHGSRLILAQHSNTHWRQISFPAWPARLMADSNWPWLSCVTLWSLPHLNSFSLLRHWYYLQKKGRSMSSLGLLLRKARWWWIPLAFFLFWGACYCAI